MLRTLAWGLMVLMLAFRLSGCVQQADESHIDDEKQHPSDQKQEPSNPDTNGPSVPGMQEPPDSGIHEPPLDIIAEQLKAMSLEEKIGQMVIIGLDEPVINEQARTWIEQFHIGGFILFSRNIETADQTLTLLNSLKAVNEESGGLPLFFGIDQEGGAINRLPEEFIELPTNQVIGEIKDEHFAYEIGRIIGEELKSLGFNLNFAPVLDIYSNPNNPVIGDRSFGASPDLVSALGIQNMKGMRSRQIIPVVKHFPGHGDTSTDSHLELPLVQKNLEDLQQFELIPFADAINHGADVIMIAHILLLQVDQQHPATLSSAVITSLLRNQMQFDGVVITDDLTMGAITEHYEIGDAVVKSIQAGTDIVMVAHQLEYQIKAIDALINAVKQGILQEKRIDQSVDRILRLKKKYQLSNDPLPSIHVDAINEEIQDVLDQYS